MSNSHDGTAGDPAAVYDGATARMPQTRAIAGSDSVPVHATALGGAMFNLNATVSATDSTFAVDTAANDGMSIFNLARSTRPTTATSIELRWLQAKTTGG